MGKDIIFVLFGAGKRGKLLGTITLQLSVNIIVSKHRRLSSVEFIVFLD